VQAYGNSRRSRLRIADGAFNEPARRAMTTRVSHAGIIHKASLIPKADIRHSFDHLAGAAR